VLTIIIGKYFLNLYLKKLNVMKFKFSVLGILAVAIWSILRRQSKKRSKKEKWTLLSKSKSKTPSKRSKTKSKSSSVSKASGNKAPSSKSTQSPSGGAGTAASSTGSSR